MMNNNRRKIMEMSENITELAIALIKVQGSIKGAEKGSDNPFYHSKYADLESCWEAAKEPLQVNGLAVTQLVGEFDSTGSQGLTTMLIHKSGQFISQYASIPLAKKDPHGAGSGITYLRRYGLASILGLLQVDDDGNKATKEPKIAVPTKEPTGKAEYDAMNEEGQLYVNITAQQIKDAFSSGDSDTKRAAYLEHVHNTESDFKMALWYILQPQSAIRRALKQYQEQIDNEKS